MNQGLGRCTRAPLVDCDAIALPLSVRETRRIAVAFVLAVTRGLAPFALASSQRKDVSAYAGLKRGRDVSSGKLERGNVAGAEVLVDDGRSNPVPDVTE